MCDKTYSYENKFPLTSTMENKNTKKVNVLIVGMGHYSTGSTALSGVKTTDKDYGVLLPSVLELRHRGTVGNIFLVGRDGKKIPPLKKKVKAMAKQFEWDDTISYFPTTQTVDENSYREALRLLPKPGVVLIATPDATHKKIILDVIEAGFHFMVVKPVVTKMSDLRDIIHASKKKHVLGMVDYHKVYDEANLILKYDYEHHKYGDIQHIFSKMTQRRDMLTIFKNWAGSSGHNINHYLGSHYIHMVGYITGATPLSVRATSQYGVAKKIYKINTPDLIETQITWQAKNGTTFSSYHIAGWADPSETSGMTYQEIHLVGTNGHIESDQRFRGFETVLAGEGQRIINPYFFNLDTSFIGSTALDGKYGFKSVQMFVEAALAVENGANPAIFDSNLPTIRDSIYVTAILEAADKSLANKSSVVAVRVPAI